MGPDPPMVFTGYGYYCLEASESEVCTDVRDVIHGGKQASILCCKVWKGLKVAVFMFHRRVGPQMQIHMQDEFV
jgi:hypothetical protein